MHEVEKYEDRLYSDVQLAARRSLASMTLEEILTNRNRLSEDILRDVKEIAGQGRVVKVRGEYLPLIPLYQMFNIEPRITDPCEGILVILEAEGRKAALFVDELVGQQQVVVKNLEANYRKVAGISGATILGDGGVALILDVGALLRSSRQLSDESVVF